LSEVKKLKILQEVLGDFYREGISQLLFFCPRCEHHKKKLSVNLEKNLFKCWVCDWSGRDLYRVVRRYGLTKHRADWRSFGQQIEINNFAEKLFGTEEVERPPSIDLPNSFISLVNKDLPSTAEPPLNYLRSRGLSRDDIIKWKIGYCSKGKYASRIVIPSFGLSGKVNYFVTRAYDNSWRKYLNPTASKNIIFNELYLDFDEDMVLVEGLFDAVKAGDNSVPLLGSTLTENSALFQKIIENDTPIYLALDSDVDKKTNRLIELFLKYDVESFRVDISPYKDVGEMSHAEFLEKKQTAVFLNSDNYLLSKITGI